MPATHASATTEPRLPPLLVVPWADPVCDDLGVDPRGAYVERFWLPLLGPTSCGISAVSPRILSMSHGRTGAPVPVDFSCLTANARRL